MNPSSILRFWPIAAVFLANIAPLQPALADPVKLDPPVKPSFSGKFLGNGKPAALKFLNVKEREGFEGGKAVTLIFTEKAPPKGKDFEFDAFFGKFGSALIVHVDFEGDIFGCEVVHTGHTKTGFSSAGAIRMEEFEISRGNMSGHITTDGELDAFGQKWEVDLKFAAPLPESLRKASVEPKKPSAEEPIVQDEMPATSAAAAPTVSARSLPLPKDAADVQYKAMVKQIQLTSAQSVAAVTGEISAALAKQGWKEGVGSLKGAKNAILKQELGNAKLTIMIQPSSSGSTIRIMTQGLSWDDAESAQPPAASDPSNEVNDAMQDAQKALKDAFDQMPTGF